MVTQQGKLLQCFLWFYMLIEILLNGISIIMFIKELAWCTPKAGISRHPNKRFYIYLCMKPYLASYALQTFTCPQTFNKNINLLPWTACNAPRPRCSTLSYSLSVSLILLDLTLLLAYTLPAKTEIAASYFCWTSGIFFCCSPLLPCGKNNSSVFHKCWHTF